MEQYNKGGGSGARVALAVLSPIFIAAGFIVFPFLPAISAYLDGRTRTYTAAATTLVGCAALPMLLQPYFGSQTMLLYGLAALIAITTAAVYVLMRVKVPFSTGLVGSAAGGVLGAVALLGIVSASLSQPINVTLASAFSNWLQAHPLYLPQVAGWVTSAQQNGAGLTQVLSGMDFSSQVAGKTTAEMMAITQNGFENIIAAFIPAVALASGVLIGSVGYYLPVSALDRRSHKGIAPQPQSMPNGGETAAEAVANAPVPPFAAFKVPRYIVITLLLLQILTMFLYSSSSPGVAALSAASMMLFNMLMIVQALSMLSFFMNRRRIPAAAQFVLLALVAVLFSWCILPYIGIFDALFDIRTVTTRMDVIRSKGKQVFTQEGLDELRKMEQRRKNGKDKDGKNGGEGGEI